jgi:hypothetical protein
MIVKKEIFCVIAASLCTLNMLFCDGESAPKPLTSENIRADESNYLLRYRLADPSYGLRSMQSKNVGSCLKLRAGCGIGSASCVALGCWVQSPILWVPGFIGVAASWFSMSRSSKVAISRATAPTRSVVME